MEEMNAEIIQMIGELQQMRYHQKAIGLEDAKKDRYGYAFEPDDAFSAEPLGFTETALRLQTEALELFSMISRVSRFSPLFFRMSEQFEKMVSRLGSCCITKAVMEQQGDTFRLLEPLTIDTLRRMTAFNFRKCYAAFMEGHADGQYKPAAFDLSVRWAALDRRLLATAEKIEKIKDGTVKADLSENKPAAETKQTPSGEKTIPAEPAPFETKGSALPVDKAAVREALKACTAETPKTGDDPVPAVIPEETEAPEVHNTEPDAAEGAEAGEAENSQETFKREILLNDAVERIDREAYGTAARARGPELELLWRNFLERDRKNGFPCLKRLGLLLEETDPPPEEAEFLNEYELKSV